MVFWRKNNTLSGPAFSAKASQKQNKKSVEYKLLKRSSYFNARWYLKQYPDVAQARVNPILHYLVDGWKEGRNPGPLFDTKFYLQNNADVARAGVNPLVHYLTNGKKEKRQINPLGNVSFFTRCLNFIFRNRFASPQVKIIQNSPYFDLEWYKHYEKLDIKKDETPIQHFLRNGVCNPGPEFYVNEYLMIHPDVKISAINPLIHYEQWGWKEKRAISLATLRTPVFPEAATSLKVENFARNSSEHKIVTVFASFSGNGKIDDYVVYLLEKLKLISDYIIFVTDNPIFKEEINKIKKYCNVCLCERHEEYDFGSYKRGYQYLMQHNILQKDDSLLMINDSNYGPVFPFSEVIADYRKKDCDFYGLSVSEFPQKHLQSFFYIFKSQVFNSACFKDFMSRIKKELSPANVVFHYEMQLTQYLADAGFKYSAYTAFEADKNDPRPIPTKWTLTLLRDFRYPLVKIKCLQGSTVEKPEDILEYIRQQNPELYNIIQPNLAQKLKKFDRNEFHKLTPGEIRDKYTQKVKELKQKIADGKKIKVVFLVNMSSMFPSEKVMNLMRNDNLFEVELYIIPDVRFGDSRMYEGLNATYKELRAKYDFAQLAVQLDNEGKIIKWHRVVDNADIVFYPSPYDLSYSLYNPYYAVKNGILSVNINYGFFRSKYDRFIYQLDNYNNFWRTCIENEANLKEYARYGLCRADNAVVTGYAKMDKLADCINDCPKSKRKTIIIAPHHSIEKGANDMLAISNFIRYADLFLKLPEIYPDIDFIFRPHPMLFTILSFPNHWGPEKVKEYIAKMQSFKNVTYSTEGDYLQQFAKSDGIIQDCGSYLVEYLYTQKPGCYMLKTRADIKNKFTTFGQKCLKQYYIAYKEKDIVKYINDIIIQGHDPKKDKREKFAQTQVMINYPHASDKIVQEIKKELLEN